MRQVIILGCLLSSLFLPGGCHVRDDSSTGTVVMVQNEKTLAGELLNIESQYSNIAAASHDLLNDILNEGVIALNNENVARPETSDQAIFASEVVSRVLAKHNFLQPLPSQNSPDTFGQALTPVDLSNDEINSLLAFNFNINRAKEYTPNKPIYLVDCDTGSLIISSVFEKMGWSTYLVKAPFHMYLRWQLPNGTYVNWDWSVWKSLEDGVHSVAKPMTAKEQTRQGTYFRNLSRKEVLGYFIGLIGSNLDDEKDAKYLLEQAIDLAPNDPTVLNNLAGLYSTNPDLASEYSEVAIMYAHRAVAADLLYVGRMGTLACAYAADGQWELAISIMTVDADLLQVFYPDAYVRNLNRVKQHELCN